MAGKKKSKKPAANPARGFATTSIASSKPRADPTEAADDVAGQNAPQSKDSPPSAAAGQKTTDTAAPAAQAQALSPEEYERQLEESELQLLVEKYAQKVRRDAQRQNTRLETDRRLLRGQAESIGAKKWLPQELMDHVLDLIQAEGRFAASSVSSDGATSRLPAEEDLIVKLWTLQLTLTASDCPPHRIQPALQYVLDIAPNISPNVKSDSVWGLDEVLDWLARECDKNELPDYYTGRGKTLPKSQAGMSGPQGALVSVKTNNMFKDTPQDSPAGSGRTTPFLEIDSKSGSKLKNGAANSRSPSAPSPRYPAVKFDEDIEPDQLLPFFLETKQKLFAIQRPRQDVPKGRGKADASQRGPEEALLLAKIDRVEKDVLFDKYVGEQEWRRRRIALEREYAAAKRQKAVEDEQKTARDSSSDSSDDDDDVAKEAERIAAEVLAENSDSDDQALADLFASLPVNEVDPITGKSSTVMNNADGSKITIRDFGKWTGVTPMRALEEACRSRFGFPRYCPDIG
jgi:ATP-dependent RNA helicase DHX29